MAHKNKAEEFIYNICSKSFFSLWSFPNPIRDDDKELCDILVRFQENIIIFSVKNVKFKQDHDDYGVAAERWRKSAIEKSVKQTLGAERYLCSKRKFKVAMFNGEKELQITDIDGLRIHKVSVSLGGGSQVPFTCDLTSGKLVHILDEEDFRIVSHELDQTLLRDSAKLRTWNSETL